MQVRRMKGGIMNKAVSVITVLAAAGSCSGAGQPVSDAAALRQEVIAWMRAFEGFEFTGTVEFEKIIRTAPDPSRIEHLSVWSEDSIPVFKLHPGVVLAPEDLQTMRDNNRKLAELYAFQRGVAREWAANGIEIAQAWRVDLFDADTVRVEYSQRHLRPADWRPEPTLQVTVRNGQQAWVWFAPTGPVYHNRPPRVDGIASDYFARAAQPHIDQAVEEVERVFDREWLLERDLVSVEQRGGAIVAKLAGEPSSGDGTWTWRLEFRRSAHGLLLTRRVTIARDTNRYFVETFSDHRPLAGRMVAYRRTMRQGPIEEFEQPDSSANSVTTYRFRTIRQALTPLDLRCLSMPEGALEGRVDANRYTYADTAPGRVPFKPAQTLPSAIPGLGDE